MEEPLSRINKIVYTSNLGHAQISIGLFHQTLTEPWRNRMILRVGKNAGIAYEYNSNQSVNKMNPSNIKYLA